MARNITVYFADGSQHVYENVPDEVTPEQVTARANRDFGGRQIQHLDRSAATEPETTVNPLKGAVARGAELIGSGIETLGRAGEAIGDVIAEKLPFLDTRLMVDREGIRLERPTPEQIRTENQLQYMQDWADSFKNWGREINYEPSTQLGELADNPLKVVPFVVERVIASSPDMVAAATALPAYIPTRANEILNERLKNDNKSLSEATIGDVAAATGAAVVEGTLERFATRRLVTEGAEAATRAARIGKEAGVQAGTEAIEEVGAYAGETVGTQAGFDPRTAALTGLEAAIVGGGLGAGVQTGREVFGRRPEEAPPVTAPTEELAPELTPEALAPKVGRPARAAPIRARTLEELRGELPAAPVVEAEAVAAPPREPIQFERTKEPTPEAIEEVATFNEQFPEGGKEFNLFKARSIARKLGYEGVTNKTTRAEIEPLLRAAVAPPVEVPAPAPVETIPADVLPSIEPIAPPAITPTVTPSIPASALPEFEVPEVAKLAYQVADVISPPRVTLPEAPAPRPIIAPEETVRVYHSGSRGEGETGRWVSTNKEYAKNYRPDLPLFYMDIPANDPRVRSPDYPEQGVREGFTFNFELTPEEATQLKPIEAPRMEVSRELPRTGIEQAVVGAGAGSAALPVSRVGTAGPEVAEPPTARLERVSGAPERVDVGEAPRPAALKRVEYKSEGADYEQGLEFNYEGRKFYISPKSGMLGRPLLNVFGENNERIGDYYADNERGQVDSRVNDASQIDQYNLPPEINSAVKNYLSSYDKGSTAVSAAGKQVANAVNAEMAKYEAPAPAAPARIFESIDILNRPLPPVTEQLARDRAPSLRRELSKAVKQFDADKMSGAELANRASMLLLQTQKERIVQPRQRGAEFVRERLMNASRRGEIDPDGVELASWFIQQNPLLVDDLGISIRKRPEAMEGTAAFYNPASRVVTLFKDAGDPQTATHEILHHTERLMPANIRAGILEAYVKQLTKAEKKAKSPEEKAALKTLLEHHLSESKPSNYDSVMASLKDGALPKSLYQYVNPSEFWAVNGARIVQGRYDIPPGVVAQIKKWLREFIEKAKSTLGMTSDAPIIRALDSLAKADGKYQTRAMLAEAPAYMEIEPTKKPKAMKPKKSVAELRREASEKMMKPGVVREAINKLVGPEVTYEKLAKNFQNQRRKLKKIQDDLRLTGRLETVGEDKNDAENSISTAANRASYIVQTEVEPVSKRLREGINAYAKSIKATTKDALEKIDGYLIALHEPERRETKYLRNVPLNNTAKMEFLPGEPAMTAADARAALESRRSLAKNAKQAEAIQDMMRFLAANYADPRGYSPVKARLEEAGKPTPEEMTTDFYDDIYSVIGPEYTQEDLEALREEYEGLDAEQKQLVDQVREDLNALHELNKTLNRRANYWTDKVDRVVESYGWKNYVPFKGSPRADKTLDTDTEYLSGELSQVAESFEGRRTNFDSPVLQTIAESYFAASRAGRGTDVTTTIKNLIKLGVIKTKTKKPKIFTFEERNSPDFDYNEVRGADKVLHYNEDGSVEVYRVEDPEVLEAIKTTYRDMNWAVKMGNALTSTLGQLHTRFNPAFPPMDFVRNSITNAGLISAREGGKLSREYLSAVAANVARLGFFKAGKLSNRLAQNDTAELKRLYNTGDPFYRDAIDMMKYGGRTMYRMSFNISDTMEELQKELGPKKIMKDPSQFLRWVDAYNDAFELTSRVAAYSIRKQQNIAEAKKKGRNINDRRVIEDIEKEAAAFALSLMDFRKIGKYGRELGAYFMFIRPAATGAVDAIDALRPGFQSREKAFARLEPEVQELFETKTLAEEVNKLEEAKRPNKKKIEELKQEIARREKSFDEFESRRLNRAKNARNTAFFTLAAGAAIYGMAAAVSGEDDEGRNRITSDDMSRWTRYARLPLIGSEGFLQVPWGFGVSALMSAGAQTAALLSGNSSFKDYAGNMVEIGIDSYLPIPASRINPADNFGAWLIDSVTPSAARPLVEFVLNVDAMGNPIYNSRAGKYADAFTGSARTSEMHRKIAEKIFEISDGAVSFSPDSVAFFLNNYADAPNHLAENSWNLYLTATGDKDFDLKKDTFILRSFIGRNSNYDARKFAEAEKEIKSLSQRLKTFEDFGTPEQLTRFYDKNPNADILIQIYNQGVNGELRRLRQERNEILRDRTLTPKERDMYIDDIRLNENYIKKGLVEDFEAYKGN